MCNKKIASYYKVKPNNVQDHKRNKYVVAGVGSLKFQVVLINRSLLKLRK